MAKKKRLLLDSFLVNLTIDRICHQLVENHDDFSESVILGLQPRGVDLAERVKGKLERIIGREIHLGTLDITFYRDDFRRRDTPLAANTTAIDFIIENKRVILIDDVLYTGRSLRAALSAMNAYGRPKDVELAVMIDRQYAREFPIEAKYIGKEVTAINSEKVIVNINKEEKSDDKIWLVNK